MTKTVCLSFVLTVAAAAQIWIPDGTPVRVKLDQDLMRNTPAVAGDPVEFSVIEEVRVQQRVVIAVGAQAMGTLVPGKAEANGKPGLDVAINRVRSVDGSWLHVRYSAQKNAAAGLARADYHVSQRDDPKLLLPHGATFALYVDEPQTNGQVTDPPPLAKEQAGWLADELAPDSLWPQRYSNALCAAGGLLIVLGMVHRRKTNREF